MLPTPGQLALLIVAIAFFGVGGVISIARLRNERPWMRIGAKANMWSGVTVAMAVLIWHSMARGSWLPLEDNFDSLIWLALVLAVFVLYVQRRKPLGGLDWFVMPIVILLLVGALVVGMNRPRSYDMQSVWSWVHRAGAYGGAAAFAVAGTAGAMYLITNYRLRHKVALAGPNLGSLERLEQMTLTSVTLGFALLTVGAIVGLMKMRLENRHAPMVVILSAAVWLVYAVVLHSPMNPSFRGRRAAVLSIVGFLLMIGTVVLVLLTSRG